MLITRLETCEKGKIKVYIDQEYHFILYQKDLNQFHMEEGTNLTQELYEDIFKNTVLRRAKQKALAILKFMDRTEQELIVKLKSANYTEEVISQVILYINNYHYLDDERYAINYIHSRKNSKSKRQIYAELVQKGINKEHINHAFEEEYEDEEIAIKKAIAKKGKDLENMSEQERLKLSASLYRKGFQADLIRKYIG